MIAAKKCAECRGVADYPKPPHSSRPVCRSCYLAHLKRLAAIYGGADYVEQHRNVLIEIRKVEGEGE
jgi:hypothetical protein